MNYEQYTRPKGETYVLGEDITRDGFSRPVVIEVNRRGRGDGYQRRSYRSDYWPRRSDPDFGNYTGYVPQWYRNLNKHKTDRRKLIAITAIASAIMSAKLPLVLSLFQP